MRKLFFFLILPFVAMPCMSMNLPASSQKPDISDTALVQEVALYLTMLEHHAAAARCYDYLLKLHPADAELYNNAGVNHALAVMNAFKGGELRFMMPLELALASRTERGRRGFPYSDTEIKYISFHISAAIKKLERVVNLAPTWSTGYLNLAIAKVLKMTFEETGNCNEIRTLLDQAYELSRNDASRAHALIVRAQLHDLTPCKDSKKVTRFINDTNVLIRRNDGVFQGFPKTSEMIRDNLVALDSGQLPSRNTKSQETVRFGERWREILDGIYLKDIYSQSFSNQAPRIRFASQGYGQPAFSLSHQVLKHSLLILFEFGDLRIFFHRPLSPISQALSTARGVKVGTDRRDVIGYTSNQPKPQDIKYGIPWKIRDLSGGEEFIAYAQNKIMFHLNRFGEVKSWVVFRSRP